MRSDQGREEVNIGIYLSYNTVSDFKYISIQMPSCGWLFTLGFIYLVPFISHLLKYVKMLFGVNGLYINVVNRTSKFIQGTLPHEVAKSSRFLMAKSQGWGDIAKRSGDFLSLLDYRYMTIWLLGKPGLPMAVGLERHWKTRLSC